MIKVYYRRRGTFLNAMIFLKPVNLTWLPPTKRKVENKAVKKKTKKGIKWEHASKR